MNELSLWIAGIGLTLAITTALGNIFFRMGQHSTRLEALEVWRVNMRQDMHEISDSLGSIKNELRTIHTLVEERTERRNFSSQSYWQDDRRDKDITKGREKK